MNIIANDCIGGFLYRELGEQYASPFIWTVLRYKDFRYILEHYNDIDWKNVEYEETPNYLFSYYMSQLKIDGDKFRIFFPHHIKMKDNPELKPFNNIPGQSNYVYEKMDEYILEKYNKRVERMAGQEPLFIYSQENRNSSEEIKDLLKIEHPGKLILITSDRSLLSKTNKNTLVLHKEVNEIPQDKTAEFLKNNHKNLIETK